MRYLKSLGGVTAGAAALASVAPSALAQPALDRVLSDATVEEGQHCAVFQVSFNFPVRYLSHFPVSSGDDLRVRIRAADRDHDSAMQHREAVRPPESQLGHISEIQFDGDRPDGATLSFQFNASTQYRVGQGPDFRSIRVAVNDGVDAASCSPDSHPSLPAAALTIAPRPAQSEAPQVDVGAGDPLLTEARSAMTAGDNAHAVQLLTRILEAPDSPSARDAQELLGLARERAGQRAHAHAEYDEYLRRYPSGEGADRVRQRLAALVAMDMPQPRPELRRAGRQERRGGVQWEASASLSQIYFRDDATYTYESMFGPPSPTTTDQQTNQNELLTALDADVAVATNSVHARLRASGAYTNDFRSEGKDESSLSALYLEVGDSQDRFVVRGGRQTRSTSGVFGRFDGGVISLRPTDRIKIDVIGGYPVDTPRDLTFDPHRSFYAASVDYQGEKWDASIYWLRQMSYGLIDRDAAGLELRYVSDRLNLFALADYDVHYNELNIGLANATFTLPGETTLNLGFDYRKAPMLATINALVGQSVGSLDELRATYTDAEIEQLALDRTAQSTTYFAGIAHPISERFSINVDATLSNLDGTPASGGVPATTPTGQELYASAQIIGTSLFKEGDLGIVGIRYADTSTSVRYGFDLNTRYPVTRALKINPRFRLSYRENKNDDGTQLSARPSFRLNYQMGRHGSLEADVGAEWQRTSNSSMREESWDYFVTAGYRLDF
jgi:hypothetical protein